MFIVMTRVRLKPGTEAECAEIFRRTNPALVRGQPDWLGAQMLFDPATETVTVLATWADKDAYKAFSATSEFQAKMGLFAPHFAGPPEVTINQLLVEMAPE